MNIHLKKHCPISAGIRESERLRFAREEAAAAINAYRDRPDLDTPAEERRLYKKAKEAIARCRAIQADERRAGRGK